MSAVIAGLAAALVAIGVAFFAAGSVGVLRFPDVYTRLHAVTKADNVGLGFVVLALAITAPEPLVAIKLFVIWFLILVASLTGSHLIARTAHRAGAEPWRAP
jgi:multicomponent Na+:H+ antiporter subunit G